MNLDEILEQTYNYILQDTAQPNAVSMTSEQHLAKAKQQILDYFKSLLPMEAKLGKIPDKENPLSWCWGYNQCLKDINQIIDKEKNNE